MPGNGKTGGPLLPQSDKKLATFALLPGSLFRLGVNVQRWANLSSSIIRSANNSSKRSAELNQSGSSTSSATARLTPP